MLAKRFQYIVVMMLCLVTTGLYARSAFFPFCLLDDVAYVTNNAHVMQGLSLDTIKWAFTSVHSNNWIPLTWLSFALDARFFGTAPMGYHIENVIFHVINVWLLFYLLERMTASFWRSLLVAALFAIHPLRVESVAWIAERKDVLSTMFWLLTLISYVLYVKSKNALMYVLSLVAFALGLLSKQMLITTPAILLLIDFWPLKRLAIHSAPAVTNEHRGFFPLVSIQKLLVEKIPFLLLAATATVFALYANYVSKAMKSTELLPMSERVVNSLWYLFAYLYKTFIPINLSIVYPIAREPYWKAACASILIGTLLVIAFKSLRNMPYLPVGLLFYLVTVFPVIGLVQIGTVSIADRFVYIPLIGIFIIISWGAGDIVARWPPLRATVYAIVGILLVGCMVMTSVQLSYWKDNTTLFRHALDVTEENHVAHETLGLSYANEGKAELALNEFTKARNIGPECPVLHAYFGDLLDKMGRPEIAVGHYKIVTELSPNKASSHMMYARILQKLGKFREAIAEYELAIAIEPGNALLHDSLGLVFLQLGRYDESIKHFSLALNLDPTLRQTISNLQFAESLKNSR